MFHRWRCYFLILSIFSLVSLFYSYTKYVHSGGTLSPLSGGSTCPPDPELLLGTRLRPLTCHINQKVLENVGMAKVKEPEESICYQDKDTVFVPFALMKKIADDIKGELSVKKPGEDPYFAIETSFSRVFKETAYQGPKGPFIFFGNFDVESRSRVLCTSADESVPVSSQWDKDGYLYPTQIAQYGLSHWSKSLRKPLAPNRTLYESGLPGATADWDGDTTRVDDRKCIHFDTTSSISLKLSSPKKILFFDLWPTENVTFLVSILLGKQRVYLVYTQGKSPPYIKRKGNTVTFTYSDERSKLKIIRNLHNDLIKGGLVSFHNIKSGKMKPLVERIKFSGVGCLRNLTLSNEEHFLMFMSAAEWFVRNQDRNGGWPVNVLFNENNSKYPKADEIQPGWYSGMAQGHALSLLSRAYISSGESKYLKTAFKALPLFNLPSSKGGFKTSFLGTYVWYEEYPTNPSSFVLNGFIYSLFGLYDLSIITPEEDLQSAEARALYYEGLSSLIDMVYLFDVGYRSVYDLRHFTMKSPPKLARWDYHSTHINLLYALSSVQNDSSIQKKMIEVADRWTQYMLGDFSEHN